MKNKAVIAVVISFLAVSLTACGGVSIEPIQSIEAPEVSIETETEVSEVSDTEVVSETSTEVEDPKTDETVSVGDDFAPDITFSTTDARSGAEVDEKIFAGYKLTMVNFWEPWCGPCVGEMPDLQKIYSERNDDSHDFNLIGAFETKEDSEEIMEECGITYTMLDYVMEFDVLQTDYVPTTVFFDGNGKIVYSDLADEGNCFFIGSRSYQEWNNIIDALLEQVSQ